MTCKKCRSEGAIAVSMIRMTLQKWQWVCGRRIYVSHRLTGRITSVSKRCLLPFSGSGIVMGMMMMKCEYA